MSWIKNFLHSFKKNDEEYEDSPLHIEHEENTISSSSTSQSSQKMEARIAYHYPKGQFRFPLIPDEKSQRKEKAPVNRKLREKEPPLKGIAPESVTAKDGAPHKPVKERTVDRAVVNSAIKNEKPIKKVRPFTPTDIPSPVYGFQRPKKINLVEHELSGFEATKHEESLHLNDPVDSSQEHHLYGEEMEKGNSKTDIEILSSVENSSIDEVAEPVFTEIIQPTKENVLPPETIDNRPIAAELLKPVFEPTEAFISKEKQETELSLKEYDQTETENPGSARGDEGMFINMALPVVEPSVLEVCDDGTGNETAEDPEQEIQNPFVPANQAEVSENEEPFDNIVIIDHPEETQQDIKTVNTQNDISKAELEPEPDTEPEPAVKEKTRRHLPFNVMMLKQDKRKLEEKSARLQVENITPVVKPLPETPVQTAYQPETILEEIDEAEPAYYALPSLDLLNPPVFENADSEWLAVQEIQLTETLQNFNVGAKVVNVTQGPSVTRFEVQPDPGVKVNKITNLADDIKLSLAARDIRIEAPIPGKHTIGIEVPNQVSRPVTISEIIHSNRFSTSMSPLTAVLGLDISGEPIVTDLKKMPHGLIAGATGSGKSVCINSILISLLYKASPEELKLLLIDPKMVELAPYNQIPHLVSPVITDVKAATAALKWAVDEMERRYELFAHTGVRDINRFNDLAESHKRFSDKLPFIVIIIDELADLMMMSPADVEEAICRIAQKARACGIHLIVATQRPSVDVITGLIKANIPTRVAFSVSSQIDSRTIIDISGAEKLLGRGDMLFLENGSSKPVRLQGTYVSDEEIDKVVAHVRKERAPEYLFEQEELLKRAQVTEEEDELFYEACEFVVDQNGASTSSLQRRFKIGYNRAARLMDMMEQNGFISGAKGSRPREVLITETDLEAIHETSTIN